MRLTKEIIVQEASLIADQKGLNHVTLKTISEALGIRSPSLYNHITNLDGLLHEVARSGMKELNQQLMEAAIGSIGDTSIYHISQAYLRYLIKHPGVYECIQWAKWQRNEETDSIFMEYQKLLERLLLTCGFPKKDLAEISVLLMGFLHGYLTMILGKALHNEEQGLQEVKEAVAIILLGLHTKYDA